MVAAAAAPMVNDNESMSVWTNKFTCPGFMFVPRKPWSFGNKYHSVCCCTSGIMWGIEMVERKDHPQQLGQPQCNNLSSTVGLLRWILTPIFFTGFIMILDSGFCMLKGIVELRKKGVFASALIKKRWYWPQFIHGDEIKEHFNNKQVVDTDSWAGHDRIPSTTPGAEPPRDAKDSGSARSHSTHLENSSSNRP